MNMADVKHRVVVVGGSAGGLRAASLLAKKQSYDVTLISKNKTFDHRTSLYRNKRGRSRRHISFPLHDVFRRRGYDIDLVRADIQTVDPLHQVVCSPSGIEYAYDSLIIALEGEGRVPYGIDKRATHNAYSAGDMNILRRQLINEFENGRDGGSYVVVGAGETGVEIVYELRLLINDLSRRYKRPLKNHKVVLVEGSQRILPKCGESVSRKVMRRLRNKEVSVIAATGVSALRNGRLQLDNGQSIDAKHVILAAGRQANHFFADNKSAFLLSQSGFVRVNSLQEAEGYNNIYIIGNSKETDRDLNTSGRLYDAEYVAELLVSKHRSREIPLYDPPPYYARLQLGRTWGVYETFHGRYSGRSGWLLKRWLDRRHFSTLLPTRLWFSAWTRGTRHDEIN